MTAILMIFRNSQTSIDIGTARQNGHTWGRIDDKNVDSHTFF